jgi:chain length determinant protein tyrosine kinase EpsG
MSMAEMFSVHAVSPKTVGRTTEIGALLLETGKIRMADVERVVRLQGEKGLRFGEAAIGLGLITESDVVQALSRQFDFPYLVPGESGLSSELIAAYSPLETCVETFRALRSRLMLGWFDRNGRKNLAVVSVHRGEGRSYLAANLAVVFAQLGERTLLIDADLRSPRQHLLFDLPNQTGLSTLLAGRAGADSVDRIAPLLNLSVLPAGPTPPNPQELLGRPAFRNLLSDLGKDFDVIILDTPAAEGGADAQTIAIRAGGALMVVRRDHTRVSPMRTLAGYLASANAVLVGAVINTV